MLDITSQPDDPAILKQLLSQVMARNTFLEELFRLAQQKNFGASSEGHRAKASCLMRLKSRLRRMRLRLSKKPNETKIAFTIEAMYWGVNGASFATQKSIFITATTLDDIGINISTNVDEDSASGQ
ncbi:MAG: hypothetical protein ACI9VT_001881 [Psychroserpens sp.]|jgi:hypothetical protein